ncbi:MAG: TRAP transporter solute receptor TAXI family [Spirochaetes bacterium]|nr:MAG: TRAP transporter solute receptor TAXI family [Spirochaetota bacterium]
MKKFMIVAFCLLLTVGAVSAQQRFIAIGTGGTAGTYYPLGGAMAEIWNRNIARMNATAQSTGASAANINLLRDGKVDVVIIQNDVGFYALNGVELFKDRPFKDLRGMACLYNETVQLVALESSGIKTVYDLKGKKVSVGAAGSGVEANARQILEAAGLSYADIRVQYLSFAESASNLKDGNIDAAFTTGGFPIAAIQDLAISKKTVLVPVDKELLKKLMDKWSFYAPTIIPAKTYSGIDVDVPSVAVKSMLAVSTKIDANLVYEMLKTMFENGPRLVAAHAQGANIKLATALEGMSLPLHPGAEKFYKEIK